VPGWFRSRPTESGAIVVLLGFVWSAAVASASNLEDVRVGPHDEYTRVVLQTDERASYSLNQSAGVVTLELQASSTPKAVTAKSQQLSWVRVEPMGASSRVRIELKGPARVKQMVLVEPHRIVLDVYADPKAASAALPVAQPQPVTPEPAPAQTPQSAAADPLADEAARVQQEADALLGPVPEAVPGDELAAAEGAPTESTPADEEATASAEPSTQAASQAPSARSEKVEKGVIDWLTDKYILAGLAIVMAALFVILRRRRPSAPTSTQRSAADESAASLFAASSEAPAETETIVRESSDEAQNASGPAAARDEVGSPFEFEAPEIDPEKPEFGPAQGATLSTIGAVTSTAAYETKAPIATGGLNMAELERRLALLEQRLEEVIDAKDRLERQVSAQTEELRVQRAAIARTQRVLRTVVRPEDDQASEPVLKS
jgi:hypothetical protein